MEDSPAEKEREYLRIDLHPDDLSADRTGKLKAESSAQFTLSDIIAVDPAMVAAKNYIPIVASCDLPVMIYGETGTGKDVFAQAIHNASARHSGPFLAQNCAAIPETLLESILFGTSKGAFTGAVENMGLLDLANGGTLFLDEINSMPIALQSKLLRVLQEGSFRRLGSQKVIKVDLKIIAALNEEPWQSIAAGTLRKDIYYRLSMMSISIPPLRERKKDIPPFVMLYVKKHNHTFGKRVEYISHELLEKLEAYAWPGNIRELEHIVVYGMSRVQENSDTLKFEDIEPKYQEMLLRTIPNPTNPPPLCPSLPAAMQEYEASIIEQALEATHGNVCQAAKVLNIPRQTLQNKINLLRKKELLSK